MLKRCSVSSSKTTEATSDGCSTAVAARSGEQKSFGVRRGRRGNSNTGTKFQNALREIPFDTVSVGFMRTIKQTFRAARAICSVMLGDTNALPRLVTPSAIKVMSIQGMPRECGREYAERVLSEYPGYQRYLTRANTWLNERRQVARLIGLHAPHLDDFHAGMCDVVGSKIGDETCELGGDTDDCTSFSVAPRLTLDGEPLTGQNKDTDHISAKLYVLLKISMTGGPKILSVVYPGEVLG